VAFLEFLVDKTSQIPTLSEYTGIIDYAITEWAKTKREVQKNLMDVKY